MTHTQIIAHRTINLGRMARLLARSEAKVRTTVGDQAINVAEAEITSVIYSLDLLGLLPRGESHCRGIVAQAATDHGTVPSFGHRRREPWIEAVAADVADQLGWTVAQ